MTPGDPQEPIAPPPAQLLFDADDTLWRTNEIFEDVYKQFETLMHALGYEPANTMRVFRSSEMRRVDELGTGHTVFLGTLNATCLELGGENLARQLSRHTDQYVAAFDELGSHLYEDTIAALERLKRTNPMALVTRGNAVEQHTKIALSGLGPYFQELYVVPDKTPDVYLDVLEDLGWPAETTWMVGNSLRHDIHPAITAGLGTVHVDRAPGWVLEHAEPPEPSERCVTVSTLTQVADMFSVAS